MAPWFNISTILFEKSGVVEDGCKKQKQKTNKKKN